ncbi:MAG: glutaminyl-peptide cyclotransferase [Rhodospirillales bacterium]
MVASLAVAVASGASAAEEPPILHGGEAPQIGHERIYGQSEIPIYSYRILKTYAHDRADYTEALFTHEGVLYEGTGQYGRSRIKRWDLESGKVLSSVPLSDRYFGEGAVVLKGRLHHLTYISNTGFIRHPDDLSVIETFHYPSQGWGLTTDGESLIMSDGSSAILFIDPEGFTVQRYIIVKDAYSEVGFLNELEYVDGEIYANVWQTDYIVRFSAETGAVTGWLDLTGLNPEPETLVYPQVLNGIAYNGQADTLFVTGKNWPNLWHIELIPVGESAN